MTGKFIFSYSLEKSTLQGVLVEFNDHDFDFGR